MPVRLIYSRLRAQNVRCRVVRRGKYLRLKNIGDRSAVPVSGVMTARDSRVETWRLMKGTSWEHIGSTGFVEWWEANIWTVSWERRGIEREGVSSPW
jgi:hypothetical protein